MHEPQQHEEELFDEALTLQATEREAFLNRACGNSEDLRVRVTSLLRAYDTAGGFMEQTPSDAANVGAMLQQQAPIDDASGQQIGRYKLLERLGEGGCGVVYMAEQEEPVRRQVALKIIKLGMDTRAVIARFEAERQALALMDHPNIARVFDAGATASGRPYFVMELVRGRKITEFCDEHALTIEQRLRLFIDVCMAVQHAHQKGIIHRDLKPSNILVERCDAALVTKVIDFGIVKATQERLTEKTMFTAFEQFIGTPAYMSPEQALRTAGDVDTRSDIYSLGALLYELLVGRPPFESAELARLGLDVMRKTIVETEPPRPSARLKTTEFDELSAIVTRRSTEPSKLISLVRDDLDSIVMRCLEKDRRRRYETANGLARDVARHLANEPVVARPPSRAYRFGKFARRNRTWVLAGSAVAVALIAGLTLAAVGFARARTQQHATEAARHEAEDLVSFMVKDLKPELRRAGRLPLTAQVAEKAVCYFSSLPPGLNNAATERNRAIALEALASARSSSGKNESAAALWREALEARRRAAAAAPGDPLIAVEYALTEFVDVSQSPPLIPSQAWGTSGPPEIDTRLAAIVDRAREASRGHMDDRDVAWVFAQILIDRSAYLSSSTSRPQEALTLGREAEVLYRNFLSANPEDAALGAEFVRLMLQISTATQQVGSSEVAIKVAEEAVTFADRELEKNPGNTELRENAAFAQMQLCYRLSNVSPEKSSAAETIARERWRVLVQMDPQNVSYQHNYAAAHFMEGFYLFAAGRTTEAYAAFKRYAGLMTPLAQSPTEFQALRTATVRLAALSAQTGDADAARKHLAAAEEWHRKYLASLAPEAARQPGERLGFLDEKCNTLGALGDWRAVEPEARALVDAVADARRSNPHDPNLLMENFDGGYWLARALLRQGFASKAIPILQGLMQDSSELAAVQVPGVNMSEAVLELKNLLGEALIATGDTARARVLLEANFADWEKQATTQPSLCGDVNLAGSACLLATVLDSSEPREAARRLALLDRATSIVEKLSPEIRLSVPARELSKKIEIVRGTKNLALPETISVSAAVPEGN